MGFQDNDILDIEAEELTFKLKLRDIDHDLIRRNLLEVEPAFIVALNKAIP